MTTRQATVAQWLEKKFREWRGLQTSRRAGITQFAAYLKVSRNTLNNWMLKGQTPEGKNLEKVSAKLGDEIYDLLGLARPDPQLRRVSDLFNSLPPDARDEAEAMLRKLAAGKTTGKGKGNGRRMEPSGTG